MPPTILIVTESPSISDTYRQWLRDRYLIQEAGSNEEAFERLNPAVDVVLYERRPTDSDDWALVTGIEERELDFRIIVISAIEPDFDIIPLNIDEYLLKPVSKMELRSSVDQVLAMANYNPHRAERYALLSKKVALETVKDSQELAESEAFSDLESRLEAVKSNIDVFDPPEYPSALD